MDKTKFGTFIKNSRLKKNYTQKKLADLLYIDVIAVSKWERGVSYPDITLVPEICKVLDINEHELIQSSNETEYRNKMKESENFKNIKNTTFYFTSVCYLIATFVCFIVSLAVNHTLSCLLIVLIVCLTGFTFIPTVTRFFQKYKIVAFIVSTYICLVLLFTTCSFYSVYELSMDKHWFLVASTGTLIGYFALFYPIIYSRLKMYMMDEKYQKIKKCFMFSYSTGLLLLTILLLFIVNMYYEIDYLWGAIIITITSYGLLLSYSIIEFLNINRFIKLGIDGFITCLESFDIGYVIMKVIGEDGLSKYKVNFSDWTNHVNGNVMLIVLLFLAFISLILLIIGIKKRKQS